MGTCEDTNTDNHSKNWALKSHSEDHQQQPKLGFTLAEESLVRKFENVGMNSNENVTAGDDHDDSGGSSTMLLPLRPYTEDCPYYLRTGRCKFGSSCKYNHPVKRTNKVNYDRNSEGFSEKLGQIECKYYLTAGGCKYGKSCRFNHSKPESEIALPELNILGLPLRLGEKECPFYMQNGSCGYGAGCKFHHPDPTSIGGADLGNSTLGGYSMGQFNHSSWSFEGGYSVGQPTQGSWCSPMVSDLTSAYQDNHSSYMTSTSLLPQGADQNGEWNGYQVPDYSLQTTDQPRSAAPSANSTMKKTEIPTEFPVIEVKEEYPERPGRRECALYMKTGECMFKSECGFHHPKDRPPTVALNDKLLPLRPDKSLCPDYENIGLCKWGPSCPYDHPDIYAARVPPRSRGSVATTISAPWTAWNLEEDEKNFEEQQ